MTDDQVLWASKHDWFMVSMSGTSGIHRVLVLGDAGDGDPEFIWFDNYMELRAWAGY